MTNRWVRAFLAALVLWLAPTAVPAANAPSQLPVAEASRGAEAIVAELSDQQVRRLLIEELKKAPLDAPVEDDMGGLADFIETIKARVALVEQRLEALRSDDPADGQWMGFNALLGQLDPQGNPWRAAIGVALLFLVAFAIELVFRWYSRAFRGRLAQDTPVSMSGKLARLAMAAVIDLVSLLIFIGAVMILFDLFYERSQAQPLLVATYLAAIVAVRIVMLLARFLLSPRHAALRFLPLSTPAAVYLFRWSTALSILASFGFLSCGMIRLSGASEADHIRAILLVALIICLLLAVMVFQKKRAVADALTQKVPADSLSARLLQHWHHLAIFFIGMLFLFSAVNIVMSGGNTGYRGIKALLMVPLFFLADWVLCQIIDVLFGFLPKPPSAAADATTTGNPATEATDGASKSLNVPAVEASRIKIVIRSALRLALMGLFLFWTLNIFGIEAAIGKAVVGAVLDILLVVLFCYIIWEYCNALVERKLAEEMPAADEEKEEGGAGGSRLGTLLLLLRKFLLVSILVIAGMVILSSLGVNIGPLIAGAGVLGLAIGFGAQTLVKDIISGIFFLIDDAFRLGDYITIGTNKGTVEHISLRSLKLRHPRGMLDTIPFGEISTVTNLSRDYIITKLDFRVPYDTDVEKVRKIIKKKVYKVILANEALASRLLEPIKSQGVRQMDDSAMIMRLKFKTIPGEQFAIRKEVYRLLQEAFKAAGISFAHRNVTVYMPPGEPSTPQGAPPAAGQQKRSAGAAAALAAEQDAGRAGESNKEP
jgi:small-conductance mechanosensitive channel